MSQMRRLKDETRSPFARALVESATGDRSESGACDRALHALGVGTAAGAIAATSTAKAAALASTTGAGGGALSVAPTAAKGGALLLVKWVGVAAIGGAAAIGAAPYVLDAIAPPATRPIASAPPSAVRGVRPAPPAPVDHAISRVESPAIPPAVVGPASAAAPPLLTEPLVPATRPREAPSPRMGLASAAEAPPVREADSVAPQLAELNAARAALEAGSPTRALALLDDFDLRHPSSSLREEVAVLRVDSLVDAGRLAEASDLAAAFLRAYPGSAYGQHVRSKVNSP